jgi:chloride channel protein, CIC family
MLGAAMQAPLAGLILILELTHGGFAISIPMIAATVTATAVARYVDGYSIYTARLRARPPGPGTGASGAPATGTGTVVRVPTQQRQIS